MAGKRKAGYEFTMDRDEWTTLKILCLFLSSAPQTGKVEHKEWLQHAVQWEPLQPLSLFMQGSHCCVYVCSDKLDGTHSGGLMPLRYYSHTIFSAPLLQIFFHISRRVAGNSRNVGSALSSRHFFVLLFMLQIMLLGIDKFSGVLYTVPRSARVPQVLLRCLNKRSASLFARNQSLWF